MIEPTRLMLLSLIIMRISGMILFNPILGRRNIPNIVRGGMVLVLSFVIFMATPETVQEPKIVTEYAILLLKELMIGYVLGFVVNLFSYVIIFAGEFIDLQMGLSMAKIFDASSNTSLSITATYYNIMFMLLFFIGHGHILLLDIILQSGEVVPYGSVFINPGLPSAIVEIFIKCSIFALSFTMPIFAATLIAEIAIGVLMKTIPQINVFVVNIQVKVLLGLIMIIIMYSPMSEFLQRLIVIMLDTLRNVLELMA